MEVKATISQWDKINEEIHLEYTLCDFPITENTIMVDGKEYISCITLFKNHTGVLLYEFEQLIRPYHRLQPEPPSSLLLLIGKIYFEDDIEMNMVLKKMFARGRDINGEITAPYNYMRWLDCIEIDGKILVCEDITLKDNIEISVRFYGSPITLENFRKDSNNIARHRH